VTLVAREKLAMGEAKGGRNVKREWLAPLTGVVFVALGVLGFIIGGEPPGADDPVQEIVDHYTDNEGSVIAGAILVAFAAVFLIFFAGYLRKVLSAAEGEGGVLSAVSLVGAAVMAVGIAIDATISFALAEAVEDIEPTAVQALQALWDSDFIPIAVGTVVFLLSTGISIVRHAALPKWLGWVAILLAVVGLTPIGFVAFLGGGIWILIISVMLALRARPVTAY
jgi:hypothetical protein